MKRAIELAKETIAKYGENIRLNVHVAWFGNELVGRGGIAPQPTWPYDDGDGHWPDLLDTLHEASDLVQRPDVNP